MAQPKTMMAMPRWCEAQAGMLAVLHTWGQTMVLHPHVHCIVPNGGLTAQGDWQFPKRGGPRFLYPVKAMQVVFRAHFMEQLRTVLEAGLLALPDDFPQKPGLYYHWKETLYHKNWVVYTKKPFSGVQQVVRYLARYSHRVAITNHRITRINNQAVTFNYRDYADGAKNKIN